MMRVDTSCLLLAPPSTYPYIKGPPLFSSSFSDLVLIEGAITVHLAHMCCQQTMPVSKNTKTKLHYKIIKSRKWFIISSKKFLRQTKIISQANLLVNTQTNLPLIRKGSVNWKLKKKNGVLALSSKSRTQKSKPIHSIKEKSEPKWAWHNIRTDFVLQYFGFQSLSQTELKSKRISK